MRTRKQTRDLVALVASRSDGVLLSLLLENGPALPSGLKESVAGCDCEFDHLLESARAARKTFNRPRRARERSAEWIELRITLEHLVYYTARLQLFLSGAVADVYTSALLARLPLRPSRTRTKQGADGLSSMVESWRRLRKRRVAKGDLLAENRLLADAALFAGAVNLQGISLLVSLLDGTA